MATTDVREWLRAQGESVADRGPLPKGARERFEAEHGVTLPDDDYPPAGAGAEPAAGGPQMAPAATAAGERAPRKVRPRGKPVRGLAQFWQGRGGGGKRRRPPRDRQPVTGFVEGIYGQLAWSMDSIPPLKKLLYFQAPFAGAVAEENVRGTVADGLLQPVVRGEQAFKAVNGLVTPPVALMMILTKGRRLESGEPDQATKAMIGMLRFGLIAMLEVTGDSIEQVKERAAAIESRGAQADELIAWLLAPPEEPAPGQDPVNAEEDAMARARTILDQGAPPAE